jgi:hypothetical protein
MNHQFYKHRKQTDIMNVDEIVNFLYKNSQRAQAVILAGIQKPRSYDEISTIFGIPKNSFYNKDFNNKIIETGLVEVKYFGRTPYLFTVFDEPFFAYFEKISMIGTKGLANYLASLITKDKHIFKQIFDSKDFRGFWNDNVLKLIDKNLLRDPATTVVLIYTFLNFVSLLYAFMDTFKFDFDESKNKAYVFLAFYNSMSNLTIPTLISFPLLNYLTKDMKDLEKIRETEFFKKSLESGKQALEMIKQGKMSISDLSKVYELKPEDLGLK